MKYLPKFFITAIFLISFQKCYCWGFYGHKKINYYAVFLLPPELLSFYKKNINYLVEHSTDPDKRRYAIPEEAPRHYIDIDEYGTYPYDSLPRKWKDAVAKYSEDTLLAHGIVPWFIQWHTEKLTTAFKDKNIKKILQLSAELGHYIGDAHVPLHASHNHNGQYTNQKGIHGFWESRVPELLAEKEFSFFIGKANFIPRVDEYIWRRVLESGKASDSVLSFEKKLSQKMKSADKYAFETKNGITTKTYSTKFTKAYNSILDNMVERRMRQSIYSTASIWYTAWVNAGQPKLNDLNNITYTENEKKEMDSLEIKWRTGKPIGRICD